MFSEIFIKETINTLEKLEFSNIEQISKEIGNLKETNGRLFVLGLGGSIANASHAVNDFRKIATIATYSPGDNVSELTAMINDDGWETVFVGWLKLFKLEKKDIVLALSVGGGSVSKNVSVNMIKASEYAKEVGCKVFGILGRDGGEIAKIADKSIIIPNLYPENVTPISEGLQSVILHLIVTHPSVKENKTKW